MHGKVSYLRKLKLSQVTNKTKKKKMNKGGLFNTRAQRSLESLLLLQASPSIFQRSKKAEIRDPDFHTNCFWWEGWRSRLKHRLICLDVF